MTVFLHNLSSLFGFTNTILNSNVSDEILKPQIESISRNKGSFSEFNFAKHFISLTHFILVSPSTKNNPLPSLVSEFCYIVNIETEGCGENSVASFPGVPLLFF